MSDYIRDGAEIYRRSFATIRAEADLDRVPHDVVRVVVRMIHACGMVDLAADVGYSPGVVARRARGTATPARRSSATRRWSPAASPAPRLPADNEVVCTLGDPRGRRARRALGTTRSAAAIDLWRDRLDGAVVAIGNAPTALFRLLDLIAAGAPRPAAVIGVPVGFIGAAESKQALADIATSSTSSCTAAAAAARWRSPRSTRSPATVE